MRVACILIHNLPVQVAIASDHNLRGQPLVIGGLPFEGKTVLDASPEAMACGIMPGMPLHEAYAVCPEARFLSSDDKRYDEAFETVATVLERFSPVVALECLGCAYIDIAGVENEEKLSRDILASISGDTGLIACLGVSGGKFFSRLAAFTTKPDFPVIIPQGQEKDFIAPFSVEFLPGTDKVKEQFGLLGIRFIGDLARYSREALVAQFGIDGVVMHELTHGIDRFPLVPKAKPEAVADSAELDYPAASFVEILHTCEVMLSRLLGSVNAKGKLCREVLIRLSYSSGKSEERRLPLKEPTSSCAAVLMRIQTWLETVRLPALAVGVHLSLSLTREQGRKLSLWPEQKRFKEELNRAADELKIRFGYQPIKKAEVVTPEPILPERRFRLTEMLE